jgi:nucleoside-diphosphate-sugar epimerase
VDLLTGSTGFLGSHLARRLKAGGAERRLRAIVRPGTDLKRIPPEIDEIVWGGLDDAEVLERACRGIDTVFHAAARVSGGGDRRAFERDNVVATEALLQAAAAAGVRRFVHVSSAGIFGAAGASAPIVESTPLDPEIEKRGAYAWSKAEADRRVRAFGSSGRLETVVVRPGILYGGEQTPFVARLHFPVPGARGRRLIVGSRSALLPLTHVDNACDAIALASERGRPGGAYNVIDGLVTQEEYLSRLREVGLASFQPTFLRPLWLVPVAFACEVVSRATGRTLPLSRYRLRRATESLRYDTALAAAELGWTPTVDLRAGVAGLARADAPERRAA